MTKRAYLLAGGICLFAAAALFAAKLYYEAALRGDIEAFLANLPQPFTAAVEKIDVSVLDNSVALTNLTGRYQDDAGGMEFSVARLEAKGVNRDAFKAGAGTVKFAESMTLDGYAVNGPAMRGGVERYTLENVSGDFAAIMDAYLRAFPALAAALGRDQPLDKETAGALAELLEAYESVSIGKISLRNATHTVREENDDVAFSLASAEAHAYSIREMGPFALTGLTVAVNEKPTVSWERLSFDSLRLPSFVAFCKLLGDAPIPSREAVRATLQGQPFALKNLRGKNLAAHKPGKTDRPIFDMADFQFTYEATDAHTADFFCTGLTVAVDKKKMRDEGTPDETLALFPDVFSFDAALLGTVTRKGEDTADADCKKLFVKEARLGEFSLAFSVTDLNILAVVLGTPGPAVLKNLDLAVTDTGMSDILFFEVARAELISGDARDGLVEEITDVQRILPNDALRNLAGAMARFLEKPGKTLRIALAPEKPVPLMLLQNAALNDPGMLGLTSSVTPAE